MLHMILLVLCWIFVAVVTSIEAAQDVEGAWGSGSRPDFLGRIFKTALPELTGTETLVTVLVSLLGLGAMRTAEKFGGKAR